MNFELLRYSTVPTGTFVGSWETKIGTAEVLNFLFAGVVSSANGGILASQGRTSLSAKMVNMAKRDGFYRDVSKSGGFPQQTHGFSY